MTTTVFKREALFIPIKQVFAEAKIEVEKRYTKDFYRKEAVCEKCDHYEDRPCDVCATCPNYGGRVKLFKMQMVGENKYLRLPFGDILGVEKIFGALTVINKNKIIPMKHPIKFTRTLKIFQRPVTQIIKQRKAGVLRSAPRSGKTVMLSHFICNAGLKTIILASQKDWLDNFYETFVGSDTEKAFTDMNPRYIGYAKKLRDFERFEVVLCTYQTFLSERGKVLLDKVKGMFSVMVVDEVQGSGATEFAVVVSKFACKYKIGISGTPERKDGRQYLLHKLIGPIIHQTKVDREVPEIVLTQTKFSGEMPKNWTYMVTKLEKDPKRLMLIAKTAIEDVNKGHMVLIPMARVAAIRALAMTINKLRGTRIARPFYGGIPKEQRKLVIDKARNWVCKVIVGNTRLLSTGINIPRASALYQVSPSANMPRAEQRFSRVLTPYANKPKPIIRYFLDEVDVVRTCIRSEFFQVMLPTFRPTMTAAVKEMLYSYMSKKKSASFYHTDGSL
jgi:superfamily II DNA or RNA helicase